jgi:hypothetical protein
MKYNKQGFLAVLSAMLIVGALVFAFNPSVLQAFGLRDMSHFFNDFLGGPVLERGVPGFVDVPGDGFDRDDECGYVLGDSSNFRRNLLGHNVASGDVLFDGIDDQGCVEANGYFLEESKAHHSLYGEMSFTWGQVDTNHVFVDPVTGFWSGSARFTAENLNSGQRWMQFDWDCPPGKRETQCTPYRVKTDMLTGEVSGYAWLPAYGYVSFNGLEMELPPKSVTAYVDVISNDDILPAAATLNTAPLADGYEYWRVKLYFIDNLTGLTLDGDDVSFYDDSDGFDIIETNDSNVYLNQIMNMGEGVVQSAFKFGTCSDEDVYCEVEENGETSFNKYIFAGAPTGNMLGMNDNEDDQVNDLTDRNGCVWIYDSMYEGDVPECYGIGYFDEGGDGSGDYAKEETFFARSGELNQYILDTLNVRVELMGGYNDAEWSLSDDWSYGVGYGDYPEYVYDFGLEELSFAPRYRVQKYVAEYDGDEYTVISDDLEEEMQLVTEATIEAFSEERDQFNDYFATWPDFPPDEVDYGHILVRNQMDATSETDDPRLFADDIHLLIDTDDDEVVDSDGRDETVYTLGVYTERSTTYAIGYDQVCGESCNEPANTLSVPTAEQWVCDYVIGEPTGVIGGDLGWYNRFDFNPRTDRDYGCYYTAYLPLVDLHADAEEMIIIGAVNSAIEGGTFFDEAEIDDTAFSILGGVDVMNLRNKMYAQIARYTLGQSANGGNLDLGNVGGSDAVVSLMSGRLLYAENDIYISGGADPFTDATLVVLGGDVYLEENITGDGDGKLGIIVLESDGVGGDVYVNPDVTDIYANMFLDGSLFSSGAFGWASDTVRTEGLMNQLYLKGSLMSRNTIGGSSYRDDDNEFPKGDGSTTEEYVEAVEYDLNMIRQYRLCHLIDEDTGLPDEETFVECEEGEMLSSYVDEDTGLSVYSPFVVEYDSAGSLPVFSVESGLFN